MKQIVNIINQVFELEKKLQSAPAPALQRHLDRIRFELGELGYQYHNPLHEKYEDTRTDCEARITGSLRPRMVITEVIKPVIRQQAAGGTTIVQKAIVVVA